MICLAFLCPNSAAFADFSELCRYHPKFQRFLHCNRDKRKALLIKTGFPIPYLREDKLFGNDNLFCLE